MQDLMPPINTPDSAFHDGDPTTGQLGTIVTALWLNNVQAATRDVQLEIKNVLAKAGIQPDPKKNNQLAEAISQIIGSGNYASTAYVDNGLNKKIDKASISGVLGNDNSKVPSLNLLTTELGKKQPAGNYQPVGDYATNAALNNGLGLKFDKTSVVQSTGTSTAQVMSQKAVTDIAFGVGQTWRDVTSERTKGTTYTNTRNKAMMISIAGSGTSPVITVNGVVVKKNIEWHDYATVIIPVGATYVVNAAGNILHWAELM